jgi:tetratricopeptide (TPR) repeat protein
MRVHFSSVLLGAALCAAAWAQTPAPANAGAPAAAATQDEAKEISFKAFDQSAFEAYARKLGATDAKIEAYVKECALQGTGRASDNLMRQLNPAFDAAIKLAEAGEPRAALEITKILAATEDKVLQAHLRYHLARVFLDGDDPEKAVEILNEYIKLNTNVSALDEEVVYFYAQSLADIPMTRDACGVYRAFLAWFPNASERYRATAQQRVQELGSTMDSDLHILADGMRKVGRDLKKQKTAKPTQQEQSEIVTELNRLIEFYDQKEGGGPPKGNQQATKPASNSALVGGPARVGNLNKIANLADRWGDMKDKDRKEIESDIQNNLPPHYKKLLEEYYKKLGTEKK